MHQHRELAVRINANFDGRIEVQTSVRLVDFLKDGFDVEIFRLAAEDVASDLSPRCFRQLQNGLLNGRWTLAECVRLNSIMLFVPEEVGAEGKGERHDRRMPEAATISNERRRESSSVLRFDGHHRLCHSGVPIFRSIDEIRTSIGPGAKTFRAHRTADRRRESSRRGSARRQGCT